jgi:hypothetical protein
MRSGGVERRRRGEEVEGREGFLSQRKERSYPSVFRAGMHLLVF